MNQQLSNIELLVQQSVLTDEEKQKLLKEILNADKQWSILEFKLDRTEKVKKTTAVLLEETIEELEHKRKAVEEQNRELEIETALERVRAVAMGMKEPEDMLEICRTISQQLAALNVKEIRNVQTAIFYESKGTYMNYEYYAKHDKAFITETSYTNHEMHQAFAAQMLKGKDEFFVSHMSKTELADWIAYQKTTNVFIDTYLETASSLSYYWHSLGPVALGISTYEPLSEEDKSLFKRFLKVFELSYTRYLDIEQAIAQAREAQIEAALERVRSKAMAMHSSKELKDVAKEMRKQFSLLGQKELETCAIHLWDESSGQVEAWAALRSLDGTGDVIESEAKLNIKGIRILEECFQKSISGKKDYVVASDVAMAKDFFEALKTIDPPTYNFLIGTIRNKKPEDVNAYWSVSDFTGGSLIMVTYVFPDENARVLLRKFSNVFGLAYQRFKDLKKAEAQAREAQIQLALERVRARTMAMQKSDELSDAVYVLFQQFKELGENPDQATIGIINEDEKVIEYWVTMYGQPINTVFKFSIDEPNVTNKIYNAWKENKKSLVIDLSGDALMEFMAYRASKGGAAINPNEKRRIINVAFFSKGLLNVQSNEERSEESIKLLERFASVFDQTYTRFIDLQKAETQARQAQIELGLERVRNRAMAMQTSEELSALIGTVFTELTKLDLVLTRCVILIYEGNEKGVRWWMANSEAPSMPMNFFVKYADMPFFNEYLKGWQERSLKWQYVLEGENKFSTDEFLFKNTELSRLPDFVIAGMRAPERVYLNASFNNFGNLTLASLESLSDEQFDIMLRFARVFDLTYTRFNDLKQAEAQARESQIQLALERVRARTMAMQKSDELTDAAGLLFNQLTDLGIKTWTTGFNVWSDDNNTYEDYITSPKGGFIQPYIVDTSKASVLKEISDVRKRGDEFFVQYAEGERLKETYIQLAAFGDEKQYDKMLEDGVQFPSHQYDHFVFGPKVSLMFITYEPVPEAHDIFKRFGKVFEQTYTRFLDLQRAEAQARESQIQLALERVRARTMAMQKSDELKEVIQLVYEQFVHLNIHVEHTGFILDYKTRDDLHIWLADKHMIPSEVIIPWFDSPPNNSIKEAKEKEQDFFKYFLTFEEKNKFYRDLFKFVSDVPEETLEYYFNCPGLAGSGVLLDNIGLYIENFSGIAYSDEDNATLMRFGKVFQQTYTRFLDLKTAEDQARESQIQLALERVRARTMAMQKSDELSETALQMFEQVQSFGIALWSCGFNIIEKDETKCLSFVTRGGKMLAPTELSLLENPSLRLIYESRQKGDDFWYKEMSGEEIKELTSYIAGQRNKNNKADNQFLSGVNLPSSQVVHFVNFAQGNLMFITLDAHPEMHDIFKRFGIVFEQTYTRFLDLQRAEAQAREAEIQLALERVRARSLAMHHTSELQDVVNIVAEQLHHINIDINGGVFITINDEVGDNIPLWASAGAADYAQKVVVPFLNKPIFICLRDAIGKGNNFLIEEYSGKEKMEFFKYLFNYAPWSTAPQERKQELLSREGGYTRSVAVSTHTSIAIINHYGRKFSDDDNEILKRFGNVFEQAYTRFLDLEKAEAQARESQIQLALERVRARTMAMQKSDELAEAASLLFLQVKALGIESYASGFTIWENDDKDLVSWMCNADGSINPPFRMPAAEIEWHRQQYKSWKKKEDFIIHDFTGKEMQDHYRYLRSFPLLDEAFKKSEAAGVETPARQIHNAFNFSNGNLLFITLQPVPEAYDIFRRFAIVFDQTYTRFLDLKKAEAQVRESQIEAALERVRTVAMSMMKSPELLNVCEAIYKQLIQLGFTQLRSAQIYILNDSKQHLLNYDFSNEFGGRIGEIKYNVHETVLSFVKDIKNSGDKLLQAVITGDKLIEWRNFLNTELKQQREPLLDSANELCYYHHSIENGALSISAFQKISEEQMRILERLRNVFSLSYKRYVDIALAEAQAREAQIEAALERVRSRTLAMQNSNELAETAAVLFKQLILLGIEPNRLYISIMKNEDGDTEFWITDEDGSKVSMAYEDNLNNNASFKKMFEGWKQQKKSLVIDMKGKELQDYFQHLGEELHVPFKGGLTQKRRWQYIAYFSKGFIGIASPDEQPESTIQLVERFAYVFNLTFTRFNDLKIAEAHALKAEQDLIEIKTARKKAEDTLSELQLTQKQLIQSEKMASLGELTAGIAHEIQNPLNFVNNFSEVSNELIDEMKEELATGNLQQATEIIEDIKQNLEKINHHGKRADAIVKGMLQHSRASSGKKEPTDINVLCDEYLRLSYHGLRAKDKSFNADMQTNFDDTIGKIDVVPQDIGRVLLNLFNNAFYAVNEKKKSYELSAMNYEPLVSVQTKKLNDTVEISIKDNGNGIPQNIVDKIFQPFFTTKPTGEGTGLGLSLSYDIIKVHNGEIKVETKEGEGTEFIISLPYF